MVSRVATLDRTDPSAARSATIETLERIVETYPTHFVLVDQCRFDDQGQLTAGHVVEATMDRDAIYEKLRTLPNSVIFFTGPNPEEEEGAFLDAGRVSERVRA